MNSQKICSAIESIAGKSVQSARRLSMKARRQYARAGAMMPQLSIHPTRRTILAGSLSAPAGIIVSAPAGAAAPKPGGLRFAHMTDMHVQPELDAPAGFAKSLTSLAGVDPAPAFLVTGGDHVRDALKQPRARCQQQWDIYTRVLRENNRLRTFPVIGNHDVWGWCANEPFDSENGFGKAMALERLGMDQSYYSFDAGGWHLVILDNIQRRNQSYIGQLDAQQLEWLQGDLASAGGKPVCLISHIPLLSMCALFFCYERREFPSLDYRLVNNLVHHDAAPLLKLLAASNVKLAISGHIHLLDRFEHLGMTFICNGAVCGAWWNGPFQEVDPGYGIFDLYPDGTFEHQYVTYT